MSNRDNRGWQYLDDVISGLWLGGIGLAFVGTVATALYLVVTGEIAVTGTVPVTLLVKYVLAPVVLFMTGITVIDVYGRRRVATLLEIVASSDFNEAAERAEDISEDQ
jgi:hypothetical protein